MTYVSSFASRRSVLTLLVVLGGCASSSVSVPDGTAPLSHDEVMALFSGATVHRSVPGTADTTVVLKTSADGTVEAFLHPGKSRFAHAGLVVHETGTWTVEPGGRFCVKLTRDATATSTWCRFIFRTETAFGAGQSAHATRLESLDISKN
ncbi:hypothetical protein [Paraburkholderia oxyphila]|uniref:hypothetical protein n=1 Tax=Paraburkholderia oxyphila TaxID=614212 RepID=UPI000488D5E0|nr:hypothetical protein [Paraburkholderia oxyphila]